MKTVGQKAMEINKLGHGGVHRSDGLSVAHRCSPILSYRPAHSLERCLGTDEGGRAVDHRGSQGILISSHPEAEYTESMQSRHAHSTGMRTCNPVLVHIRR